MIFSELFNPGTTLGALFIGVLAGLLSGVILGFFSGRGYEKRTTHKRAISTQIGKNNMNIQNSNLKR